LDGPSVQTAPDGYRRIVWMIKWMIKSHHRTRPFATLLTVPEPTAATQAEGILQPQYRGVFGVNQRCGFESAWVVAAHSC
jgi:hypothetical protein